MENNYSVIMAGGVGSRFWPMSTPERPKQFLDVLGIGKTLIQMTFERLLKISPSENIFILTNEEYKDIVLEQLPIITPEQVLTEPARKNTAPCIAYAAGKIHSINPEAVLIVSPADHLIIQEQNFATTIKAAINSAEKGRIATIGIRPSRPDTGYGYIEFQSIGETKMNDVIPVKQFREKPDLRTAEEFILRGNFYWNSGIFTWKTKTIIEALELYQPELFELFLSDLNTYGTASEKNFVNHAFLTCENISIDFAVMENAQNIDVVLASFDWSDLGTWGSLESHLKKDESNNAIIGEGTHLFNTKNCIVNIPKNKVAIIDGLEDYIVIQSEDKLMILPKRNEQDLKEYVKSIRK